MKKHSASVHEKKKNVIFANMLVLKSLTWKSTFNQSMKRRNFSGVNFAKSIFLKMVTWRAIFYQFMRERNHLCQICKFIAFSLKTGLKEHMSSVHENEKPFKCDLCALTFSINRGLKSHVASVQKKRKPFKCRTCEHSFFQKSGLSHHVASVHERKKLFQLTYWQKIFWKG